MGKKVLIVGGVAGGAGTAARLRRMDEDAQIIVFERGSYISFANCGLPYYVGGTIKDRRDLLLQTPEAMMARFNIEIRIKNEVTRIDRERQEVEVRSENGFYKESYDVLVLSPGSTPLIPPIPGIDAPNIFSLWNVPDVDQIKHYIDTYKPKRAVVVGGGFIGIEMAENLYDLGIGVSLVEMLDQVMTPFDYDMAQILHENITAKGIDLELKNGVKSFDYEGGVTTVTLQDGKQIQADMVILSIGIRPNGELAVESGLHTNARGGIVVDDFMQTSDPNIYALGDVIEVKHYIDEQKTMIPLAGPANRQARILANTISGHPETYRGSQGTSVAKVFDLTAASTGYNEKSLLAKGLQKKVDFDSVVTILRSHAGYYPDALPLTLKVIFDREGLILGAQAIGYEGVDKRIDVVATAIRFRGSVHDLKDLELAYAPPYSSAKDPVNMAGFVADNVLSGTMGSIAWDEMHDLDGDRTQILDVREEEEREWGSIQNSLHIPINDLRSRIQELDSNKEVVIYCAVGIRGYIGARILMHHGFSVRNLLGGYTHYRRAVKDYSKRDVLGAQNAQNYGSVSKQDSKTKKASFTVDAIRMSCSGAIQEVNRKMKELKDGEVLEVMASDPGFSADARAWCIKTDNAFVCEEKQETGFMIRMRKGTDAENQANIKADQPLQKSGMDGKDQSTFVLTSDDIDKARISFILAKEARKLGKTTIMVFTFGAVNLLKKNRKTISNRASGLLSIFGLNDPVSKTRLGNHFMRYGESFEDLVASSLQAGMKMVACTMSMDLLCIQKEELIEGIEYDGVGSYLGDTQQNSLKIFL